MSGLIAEIHRYYLTRQNNPLKKMESVIAVACKALRVFYAILTKGVSYDGSLCWNLSGIQRVRCWETA